MFQLSVQVMQGLAPYVVAIPPGGELHRCDGDAPLQCGDHDRLPSWVAAQGADAVLHEGPHADGCGVWRHLVLQPNPSWAETRRLGWGGSDRRFLQKHDVGCRLIQLRQIRLRRLQDIAALVPTGAPRVP